MSHVVPGDKARLQPTNNMIWTKFILSLMALTPEELDGNTWQLFANSVNQDGLNLRGLVVQCLLLHGVELHHKCRALGWW